MLTADCVQREGERLGTTERFALIYVNISSGRGVTSFPGNSGCAIARWGFLALLRKSRHLSAGTELATLDPGLSNRLEPGFGAGCRE